MARHADPGAGRRVAGGRRPVRISLPAVVVCVLLIAAVALGVWWWNLRSATDPISADPVDAYAVVVSSPSCPGGNGTTVRITGTTPAVTATLSGCGYATDQRLAVQYLRGHPDRIRLAGTTVAGTSGLSGKLLPIGILAAGVIAVLAAVALLVDRRRSRHLASANRIRVADIRRRAVASGTPPAGGDGAGPAAVGVGTDATAGDGSSDDAGSSGGAGSPGGGDGPAGTDTVTADTDAVTAADAVTADADTGELSHRFPGGFVIVDEQLFTHSGTEAIAAPVERPDGDT